MTTANDVLAGFATPATTDGTLTFTVRCSATAKSRNAAAAAETPPRKLNATRDYWVGRLGFDCHVKVYAPAATKLTGQTVTFRRGTSDDDPGDLKARPAISKDSSRPRVVIYHVGSDENGIDAWVYVPVEDDQPEAIALKFSGKGTR
jgi:hypothetical protein